MSYSEFCRKALQYAERSGAEEAEALLINRHSINVEIERGDIKSAADLRDVGLGIRAISNRRIGFAYTNLLNSEEIEKMAKEATKASKASRKDNRWLQLPSRMTYPNVKDTYDPQIEEFSSDKAVEICQQMITSAVQVDKRVLPAIGGVEVEIGDVVCLNSHGLEVEDKGSTIVHYLGTMARSETQISPICVEFKISRTLETDPAWVGSEAGRQAIASIDVSKAEAGKFPALLHPSALQELLTHTLIASIRGDNVSRGNSILKDKIGDKIAGEDLNLYDDGVWPGGLHSGKTDMEGVPKQRTSIIEDGVLQGFIYDNYWGRVEKHESTGNASRGGGRLNQPPYATLPEINPSNIIINPGSASEEELIEDVKDGYYIRDVQGAHQSNPETGEFSVALAPAWRIEKGEITHAVKGTMIAGNIYDLIKKISSIGKEARQLTSFIAPKLVISELSVIVK